jgi:hypothetical protein
MHEDRDLEVPERVVKQLADCVKRTSAPFPPAEGNTYAIQFNVYVTTSGRASSAEVKDSTLRGHEVEACMAGVLEGATLPVRRRVVRLSDSAPQGPIPPMDVAVAVGAAVSMGRGLEPVG